MYFSSPSDDSVESPCSTIVLLSAFGSVCVGTDILNGTRVPGSSEVACGASVAYVCDEGYSLTGEPILTCMTEGDFNHPVPACKEEEGELSVSVLRWWWMLRGLSALTRVEKNSAQSHPRVV